jgi:hypothetical protein
MRADGLTLACKYSLPPCGRGYCGPKDADKVLLEYLTLGSSEADLEAALRRFEGLYHYLKLIAEKSGLKPFDYDVVRAYWIGNRLLDSVSAEELRSLIRREFAKYLTPSVAEKLATSVPEDSVPHHSFHVLHILNTRSLTGRVPPNEETLRNCIISWGKVKGIRNDGIVVEHTPLRVSEGFSFGEPAREEFSRPPYEIGDVKAGDVVSMHWKTVIDALSPDDQRNLKHYTLKNIKALNKIQ